jgi:hypothetical protein
MGSQMVLQELVGPMARTQSNVWVLDSGRGWVASERWGVGVLHRIEGACSTEVVHPLPHPSPTAGGAWLNFSQGFPGKG